MTRLRVTKSSSSRAEPYCTLRTPVAGGGEVEIALILRRRQLIDDLVRWARKRGGRFDARPEPTPGHVHRVAGDDEQVARWADAVERAGGVRKRGRRPRSWRLGSAATRPLPRRNVPFARRRPASAGPDYAGVRERIDGPRMRSVYSRPRRIGARRTMTIAAIAVALVIVAAIEAVPRSQQERSCAPSADDRRPPSAPGASPARLGVAPAPSPPSGPRTVRGGTAAPAAPESSWRQAHWSSATPAEVAPQQSVAPSAKDITTLRKGLAATRGGFVAKLAALFKAEAGASTQPLSSSSKRSCLRAT